MTAVLDPGALLNAGPGHTIGQFFGVGGLDVASRHHRGKAGRWSTSPGLRYPTGGTFLDRACAVEWDTAAPAEHLGFAALPHYLPAPSGQVPTDPTGQPLSGSWLPVAGPLDAYGLGQPAMVEDNDRAPYRAPKRSNWHVGVAAVVLAGLVIVACCVTDGGGFE